MTTEVTDGQTTTTTQTPIHLQVIVTIVERKATWQKIVGPGLIATITIIITTATTIGMVEIGKIMTTKATIETPIATITQIPTTITLIILMILNWLTMSKPL